MPTLFAPPPGTPLTLPMPPVLESWDAIGHPNQHRLRTYLDSVAGLVGPAVSKHSVHLALSLSVGLDDHIPLARGGHDLDNYVFPLARRFEAGRFDAVFARKQHAPSSTIAIGPTAPAGPDTATDPQLSVRTTVSASSRAWKDTVHQACRAARPDLPVEVPVHLRLCFQVSAARNWSTLWKPAIDALGPLLGVPDPAHPYRPNDDRITDLELHRNIDGALGHDIVIAVWWRLAKPAARLIR